MNGAAIRYKPSHNVILSETIGTDAGPERSAFEFQASQRGSELGIIWTIVIGFLAGVIAKFLMPGKNEPSGFVLTTILGIVGAFVATFLARAWDGTARTKEPV